MGALELAKRHGKRIVSRGNYTKEWCPLDCLFAIIAMYLRALILRIYLLGLPKIISKIALLKVGTLDCLVNVTRKQN